MEAATTEPTPEPVRTRQKRAEESTYTVQVLGWVDCAEVEGGGGPKKDAWFDVATITVPARTRRKTVIEKGLRQAGLEVPDDPIKVRALNAESAHVLTVGLETPEPQLRIA